MKVSVSAPTFERPTTTRVLIESFLAQDHGDQELILLDYLRAPSQARLVGVTSPGGDPKSWQDAVGRTGGIE